MSLSVSSGYSRPHGGPTSPLNPLSSPSEPLSSLALVSESDGRKGEPRRRDAFLRLPLQAFFHGRKPRSSAPPSNLNGYKRGQSISFFCRPWVPKGFPVQRKPNREPSSRSSRVQPVPRSRKLRTPVWRFPDRSG